MDFKEADKQAREFHKMEERIVNSVLSRDPRLRANPPRFGYSSPRFMKVGVTRRDTDLVISSHTNIVHGIGRRNVVLYHDFNGSSHLPSAWGVDTPNDLWVCIYTDTQTLPEIEELSGEQRLTVELFCGTNFFFDRFGKFGQVVSVPNWIKDNRPAIERTATYKKVPVEMEPSSFEMVGTLLDELKQNLL